MEILKPFCLFLIFFMVAITCRAQDTIPKKSTAENLLAKVLQTIRRDTSTTDQRLDEKFLPYEGLIIREIIVHRLPFGIPLGDSSRKIINSLTKAANYLHHLTRKEVVRDNLFFREKKTIQPLLFADNEQYLRQLPYFQDAEIVVVPIAPDSDSADVIVLTKDVFSLGGAIGSLGLNKTEVEIRNDNIGGTGNGVVLYTLYDSDRKNRVSIGGEYVQRNIEGSFIDLRGGYQNNYSTVPGPKQENYYYLSIEKPLVNRYMTWTYALNAAWHDTKNRYMEPDTYAQRFDYEFGEVELWAAANLRAQSYTMEEESQQLRKLVGMRIIQRDFVKKPALYTRDYFWRFADLFAVLGSVTFYRQNFYQSKYIYGFGRNEDIPEGLQMEFTAGFTRKEGLDRPFIAFNYERYQYNKRGNYLSYTLGIEGYLYKRGIEDMNVLASSTYFDHLKPIGARWKQRFFLGLEAAHQINTKLNEPLYVNSQFALPEFGSTELGGTFRATAKAESVFFSPYQLAAFKFAPFVFSHLNVFSPYTQDARVYVSLGGGLRTRNESLIFGTIEIKGYYFPQKNFNGNHFRFDFSTNLIYEYKKNFLEKPDFIRIN